MSGKHENDTEDHYYFCYFAALQGIEQKLEK